MYLSVDGGATKTHILLLDDQFNPVKQFTQGSFNFSNINPKKATAQLSALLKSQNINNISRAVFGLSGMDTLEEKLSAQAILASTFSFPVRVTNDAHMALLAGSDSPDAIVIIAGTGSHCYGFNRQGQSAKTSGLDWILTDEGSGFAIGWEILRSAVRSFDGRGQKTCLESLVLDHFNIDHIYDLKKIFYLNPFSKNQIAALSPLLDIALTNNDPVAHLILENNIGQLLIALRPVVDRLQLTNQYFELVLAGSLFSQKVIPSQNFIAGVNREYSQSKVILLQKDPVWGGIKILKSSA